MRKTLDQAPEPFMCCTSFVMLAARQSVSARPLRRVMAGEPDGRRLNGRLRHGQRHGKEISSSGRGTQVAARRHVDHRLDPVRPPARRDVGRRLRGGAQAARGGDEQGGAVDGPICMVCPPCLPAWPGA